MNVSHVIVAQNSRWPSLPRCKWAINWRVNLFRGVNAHNGFKGGGIHWLEVERWDTPDIETASINEGLQ